MRIAVRDTTGTTQYADVENVEHFTDVQTRVLIQGVTVDGGEWIAPQAIVGLKPISTPTGAPPQPW